MERQRGGGSQRMRPDPATSTPTSRFASGARAPRPSDPLDIAPTLRLPSLSAPPRTPSQSHTRPSSASRALVRRPSPMPDNGDAPLVVPPIPTTRLPVATLARPAAQRGRALPWARPVTFALVAITLVVALFFGANQAELGNGNTPAPTGRAPWYAFTGSAAIATVAPPPPVTQQAQFVPAAGQASPLEPCHDSTRFLSSISQWAVPPGCYGLVYTPNPANYISRPGFGFCNWWVRVTHPNHPDITENISYPRGTDPVAGAPIFFDGNEQGAESIGHWAVAVAVSPDHYWVLISEMNFAWRGAGFGKIDYRYIHVSPHVHFVYVFS